jgi:putative ABC transport system permease protein
MFRDLRFSIRSLSRQPVFSTIAVLTLALGIGVTSAVFSVIYGALLKPPPYREPKQLVLITPARTDGRSVAHAQGWASLQWLDWQRTAKSLEGIAAYDWAFNYLVRDDGSESVEGLAVTRDYFRVTGQKPLLGRLFSEAETTFPTKPVIILGYELWQRKFGGDPNIIGKKIRISRQDTPPQVIGVMPPGIRFLPAPTTAEEPNYDPNEPVAFWSPTAPNPDPRRMKDLRWNLVARLRNGVTRAQAQAELASVAAVQERDQKDLAGMTPHVDSLRAELNREGDRILYPLLGAAALVLLIACGNVASLMLVRGLQGQQEYAVRTALGVSARELVWQVSVENLAVALAGGAVGIGVASGITAALKAIGGHAIPRIDAASSMWPVIACGFGAAVFSAVAAGFFPALRASRLSPADVLKSAAPNSRTGRQERGSCVL